jgi:hypothetical protein
MACCIFFATVFSAIAARFPPLRYLWMRQLDKQDEALSWHLINTPRT